MSEFPGSIAYIDWARQNVGQSRCDLRSSGIEPRSAEEMDIDWDQVARTLGKARETELEGAVAECVAERYGVGTDQVTMAGGTSGINFHVIAGLVPPGGEVLLERPFYEPLWAIPKLLGREVRFFERPVDGGFAVDPLRVEAALTHNTRLVIVTRLHNPTGTDISVDTLQALGEMAEAHGLWVLVDEIYADFFESPTYAPHIHPRLLSTGSLTKVYGLPWLRAGWCLADSQATVAIRQARDRGEVAWGAADRALALVLWERLDALREEGRAVADRGLRIAQQIIGESARAVMSTPPAGLIGFVHWEGAIDAVVERLLARGIGVTPGHFFGAPGGVRVGWGGDPALVAEGITALVEEIEKG